LIGKGAKAPFFIEGGNDILWLGITVKSIVKVDNLGMPYPAEVLK
jgi:hypothetical protein